MNQQLVKEFIQLLGATKIEFSDPLKVKPNPHSFLQVITATWFINGNVFVEINGEEKNWTEVDEKAKQTLIQRLRLLVYEIHG